MPVRHASLTTLLALAGAIAAVACGTTTPDAIPASRPNAIETATPYARPPEPTIVTSAGTTAGTGVGGATAAGAGNPAVASTPSPSREVTYTVAAGDTLLAIASRYDTTVEAMIRRNNLTNAASLRIGQELIIPGGATLLASATPIATATRTATPSASATATARPSTPAAGAATGTPAPSGAAASGGQVYSVVSGDNANAIAIRAGITLEQLAQANNRTPASLVSLQIGDKLIIPPAR